VNGPAAFHRGGKIGVLPILKQRQDFNLAATRMHFFLLTSFLTLFSLSSLNDERES
jgi:hypothetical protein